MKPVHFIGREQLRRLSEIYHRSIAMKDQLSAMSAECCEICGVPDDNSDDANLARTIVEHGADPDRVIAEIFIGRCGQ